MKLPGQIQCYLLVSCLLFSALGKSSPTYSFPLMPLPEGHKVTYRLQEQTISGTVTDSETGAPLPGVNILAKGTTTGTVTGIDGDYRLSVPDEVTTQVFSSIGYAILEVPINGRSLINVRLTPDVQALSEVVVTALGIKKETKKLGYATAKVDPEDINVNRTTNFMNTLQGKIAGVNISSQA